MTYFHLGPWAYESGDYGDVPPPHDLDLAYLADLPSVCDDPTQDELG